jgi:copper(I)-binding protein
VAAAAVAAGVIAGTAACGAGQISQTANQQPAVNGGQAVLKALSVRDAQIVYPAENGEATLQAGGPLQLFVIITNSSATDKDTLTSITAPSGSIALSGTADIAPGKRLTIGKPAGVTSAPAPVEGNTAATATLTGVNDVRNGLTVPLTFHFARSGEVTVPTPVGLSPKQPVPPSQTLINVPWGGEH